MQAVRQSAINFVDALDYGVDGRAIAGACVTQGSLGGCLNADAMHLLESYNFEI